MTQGRTAAQSSASPWMRSPNSVAGSYISSQPSTPGTVYSNNSAVYSVGSRTKRLARKLSFWKKAETSAADVRDSLRTLQKSHRKYHAATRLALDTLRDWSSQLAAPPKYPSEWQARLADPDLQDLLLGVCAAVYPMHAREANLTQILADFASGFRSLSYYEESCKRVADEAAAADRAYYKERRRCTRMIEANGGDAEVKADGELAVYDNKRRGLKSQLESAGAQYARQCSSELPRQFGPVLEHAKQMEDVVRRAIIDVMTARVNYPSAEFGELRESPGGFERYTPRLTTNQYTASPAVREFAPSPVDRGFAPSPASGQYTPEYTVAPYGTGRTEQYKRDPISGQYSLAAASGPFVADAEAEDAATSDNPYALSASETHISPLATRKGSGAKPEVGADTRNNELGTPPVPLDTGPWSIDYCE